MGLDITFYISDENVQGLVFPIEDPYWLTEELIQKKIKEAGFETFYIEPDTLEHILTVQDKILQPMTITLAYRGTVAINVDVSPDKMNAFLTIALPIDADASAFPSRLDIEKVIENAGVVHGILNGVLENILEKKQPLKRVLIARGREPEKGRDSTFEPLVRSENKIQPKIFENGKADFRDLNVIVTVSKGQALMKRYPPTPGIAGMTVLGQPVPAEPGEEIPFGTSFTAKPSPQDPNLLLAQVSGQPHIKDDTAYVSPVLELPAVDFNTGNLEFSGAVIIHGDVEPGFSIRVKGDLTVHGTISDADIFVQGNLVVGKGIIGNESKLKVYGCLQARFIENVSDVEVYGAISVTDEIMHSNITSFDSIKVGMSGKSVQGKIVGGTIKALTSVRARTVGSLAGTRTIVEVGAYPHLLEQYTLIQEDLKQRRQSYQKVRDDLLTTQHTVHPKVLEHMESQWQQLELEIETLEMRLKYIARELDLQSRRTGKLTVTDHVYAGVQMRMFSYRNQLMSHKIIRETTIGGTYYGLGERVVETILDKEYLDDEDETA